MEPYLILEFHDVKIPYSPSLSSLPPILASIFARKGTLTLKIDRFNPLIFIEAQFKRGRTRWKVTVNLNNVKKHHLKLFHLLQRLNPTLLREMSESLNAVESRLDYTLWITHVTLLVLDMILSGRETLESVAKFTASTRGNPTLLEEMEKDLTLELERTSRVLDKLRGVKVILKLLLK